MRGCKIPCYILRHFTAAAINTTGYKTISTHRTEKENTYGKRKNELKNTNVNYEKKSRNKTRYETDKTDNKSQEMEQKYERDANESSESFVYRTPRSIPAPSAHPPHPQTTYLHPLLVNNSFN